MRSVGHHIGNESFKRSWHNSIKYFSIVSALFKLKINNWKDFSSFIETRRFTYKYPIAHSMLFIVVKKKGLRCVKVLFRYSRKYFQVFSSFNSSFYIFLLVWGAFNITSKTSERKGWECGSERSLQRHLCDEMNRHVVHIF